MNLDDLMGLPEKPQESTVNILLPILYEQMALKTDSKADITTYRASGIGGCARKILLKLRGHVEVKTPKDHMTLSIGTKAHDILQEFLLEKLESLELRVFFSDKLCGSYDGVLKCPDGKRRLLEIKTMNVEAFERMVLFTKIYPKYKMQANVYMKGLDAPGERIDETIFLFVNKNGGFTKAFSDQYGDQFDPVFLEVRYRRDETIIKQISEKIDMLEVHRLADTLPKYVKVSECSYCGLAEICGKIKLEEKALEKAEKESNKPVKPPKKATKNEKKDK